MKKSSFGEEGSKGTLRFLRRKQEESRAKELAQKLGYSYINLVVSPVDLNALAIVSESKARAGLFAVFQEKGEKIAIATVDPKDNLLLKTISNFQKKRLETEIFICSKTSLKRAFNEYKKIPAVKKEIVGKIDISARDLQDLRESINTVEELKKVLDETEKEKSTLILETMLAAALKFNVSDIHIEPEEKETKLRYRIDGVLHDIFLFERKIYQYLISRIKLLSELKVNVHDVAQDGRFTVTTEARNIEVRVSVVPGDEGEDIVMRVLNPEMILSIEDLGLHSWYQDLLLYQIKKPTGMILTCGPTGSGKTTTLYACLKTIAKPEIKVITIENPIEYKLEGIEQTQTEPGKGYDFANALRAILRQDPDVVLVGEIRDRETAETALHAALTGHLVFSTLHTNDAAGIVPRLIEMGASPTTIAPAINLAVAQRLLRRACKKCAKEIIPSESLSSKIKKNLQSLSAKVKPKLNNIRILKSQGCSECHNSGYKRRIGIYEMFQITSQTEETILSFPSISKMRELAVQEGMITIQQDGLLRVLERVTTIEELERITGPLE